jgi:hypothetical protein
MNFTKQSITIATKNGDVNVEAMVGEGSGLAYHSCCGGDSVTAIASGYAIVHTDNLVTSNNLDDALDETITKHFIENITDLLDWHEKNPTVLIQQAKLRYPGKYAFFKKMQKVFNEARKQARAEEKQVAQ